MREIQGGEEMEMKRRDGEGAVQAYPVSSKTLIIMGSSSLNEERNITAKTVVSVWFIHFSTYFII